MKPRNEAADFCFVRGTDDRSFQKKPKISHISENQRAFTSTIRLGCIQKAAFHRFARPKDPREKGGLDDHLEGQQGPLGSLLLYPWSDRLVSLYIRTGNHSPVADPVSVQEPHCNGFYSFVYLVCQHLFCTKEKGNLSDCPGIGFWIRYYVDVEVNRR